MAKSKWNYDTCLEESKKYKSRNEFKKKCNGAYKAALTNDKVCARQTFLPLLMNQEKGDE